jgi:hypothetical protein
MSVVQVKASAQSAAQQHAVFSVLACGPLWPSFSNFTAFELERPGTSETYGQGAIRVLSTAVTRVREEILAHEPPNYQSYSLLDGMPLLDYRAEIRLSPEAGGTKIDWQASFRPKYPGTGWFFRLLMEQVLQSLARQVAKAAEDPSLVAQAEHIT